MPNNPVMEMIDKNGAAGGSSCFEFKYLIHWSSVSTNSLVSESSHRESTSFTTFDANGKARIPVMAVGRHNIKLKDMGQGNKNHRIDVWRSCRAIILS
jgi:hypothetical protein